MSAPDPLVVAEGLVRHYPLGGGEVVRAVDDVSLTIRRGETFGLVGESGSGKSSVARALLRLEPLTAGTVHFDGIDVGALGRRELRRARRRMQMVFQDPHGSLNRRETVAQLVAAPLLAHGEPAPASRIDELLELVGLGAAYRDRYPHEMSGGQCQRVAIARALALDPDFVVLDEAVSALDVSIQAQVLNLLRELQGRLGLTYLFISHDLSVIRYMAQTVAVMYLGRIVEVGSRAALFDDPRHPYTHGLLAAVPIADPRRERSRSHLAVPRDVGSAIRLPGGCRFHPRCPVGRDRERCRTVEPVLAPVGEGSFAACHYPQSAAALASAARPGGSRAA